MLTKRYLVSTKNLDAILKKIIDGVAPERFTAEHLKSIGLGGSSDRSIVPILKDLGFLTSDGSPTARYHAYRDRSRSKSIMGEALREAYEEVFHIREVPTQQDRPAIEGLFKSKHNSTDRVAQLQAMTFFALLANADLSSKPPSNIIPETVKREEPRDKKRETDEQAVPEERRSTLTTELHYTIQVHLPATKDIEVFNAIFRSLRENLLT